MFHLECFVFQGLGGLRAVDKRHLTLYIPIIFISILVRNPQVRIYDTVVRLAIQLLKVTDIIRANQFTEIDIQHLVDMHIE